MSKKLHPFFVVRLPNNEGCGHQHSNRVQAWNCAENIAGRRKNLAWITVVKISRTAGGFKETIVGRVAKYQKCDSCGGMVFTMSEGDVRGHYEDCKAVPMEPEPELVAASQPKRTTRTHNV